MKNMVKKLLLLGMAAALTLALVGCDALGDNMMEDSKVYVQGILDKFYKGQYNQEYLDLIDLTSEEAAEEYEEWVGGEAEYFCQYFDVTYPTEAYLEQVKDLYREIYAAAKYSVLGSSKLDSGAYAVEVEVEPISLMLLVAPEDTMEAWSRVSGGKSGAEMSEEEYLAADGLYADAVLELVRAQMPNLSYESKESFVFQLKEGEDGYYALVENDLHDFDNYIVSY